MEGALEARKIGALLRFYFKIDPDELDDDQFAKAWSDLEFALEYEAKRVNQDTRV